MTTTLTKLRLFALASLLALGAAPACQGVDAEGEEAVHVEARAAALSAPAALGGPDTFPVRLEVAGITPDQKTIIGCFKSASGMDSETEVIELRDGTVMDFGGLREWAGAGSAVRRGAAIILFDQDSTAVVARYRLEGARVLALTGRAEGWTGVGAAVSAMAIEKIEIAHEKLERVLR